MLYPNIESLCLQTIVFYMHWEMTLILCKLQSGVDAFINWCTENGLKINSGKTKVMITTTECRLKMMNNVRNFRILGNSIQYVV